VTKRGLSIVVCAAGPAAEVATLIRLAQTDGWTVNLISTPSALPFLDVAALERLTGSPVRSEYRTPGSGPRGLSVVEAVIVAPATYNTINKLAFGISDNYALGSLAEAIGRGTRVVVVPFVNAALAARLPYQRAVAILRDEGVTVMAGPEYGWEPHPPGTGDQLGTRFPWARALTEAQKPAGL
jgi:phosphopantothenoylcysteine synthetase/decarboxylase